MGTAVKHAGGDANPRAARADDRSRYRVPAAARTFAQLRWRLRNDAIEDCPTGREQTAQSFGLGRLQRQQVVRTRRSLCLHARGVPLAHGSSHDLDAGDVAETAAPRT